MNINNPLPLLLNDEEIGNVTLVPKNHDGKTVEFVMDIFINKQRMLDKIKALVENKVNNLSCGFELKIGDTVKKYEVA